MPRIRYFCTRFNNPLKTGQLIKNIVACVLVLTVGFSIPSFSQVTDTTVVPRSNADSLKKDTTIFTPIHQEDTALRIRNLDPYITLHVDSTLIYNLEINRDQAKYYWFLKRSPVGLRVDRKTGTLYFKAEKGLFLSGRLKYDLPYTVELGVQNLDNPADKIDTSFTLMFYNTEMIPSKVKPTVNNILYLDEGDSAIFKVMCEDGSFPIERINMTSNYPLKTIGVVTKCGDEFRWSPPFGFVKSTDANKERKVIINFVGSNKFNVRDTAVVQIVVKENINYPQKVAEYEDLKKTINHYSNQLKATFMELDKSVKRNRSSRTRFDLTGAAASLGGTVFSSLPTDGQKTAGKILPSAGVAMVPVKESVSPSKTAEQNSATLVRNSIKRLDYLLQNNALVGEKDPEIIVKTQKLRDELKGIQVQLIDVPIVEIGDSPEELDKYFNNPKVNKKYKMRKSG